MGLLPPEAQVPSGRVLFDGDDVMQLDRRRRDGSCAARAIGLVFQDPFSVLNPSLRIGEQVGEGLVYPPRLLGASAPSRVRSNCSTRSGSRIRRRSRRPTRTSSPAACASGR